MFAPGLASGNCLKPFSLVCAFVLGTCSQAHADLVRLDFQGFTGSGTDNVVIHWNGNPGGNGNHSLSTTAGRFRFEVANNNASYSNALGPNGTSVYTFCLNCRYTVIDPGTYNLTNALENLPSPNGDQGPLGIAGAAKLRILINEVFGNGLLNTYNESSKWDSVQIAIWTLIGTETQIPGFSISGVQDTASVTAILNGVTSAFNAASGSYATYLQSHLNSSFAYSYGLDSAALGGGQDQIYWNTNPGMINEVPVPAGVALAGMGIACMGAANFLRRRKAKAAV